MKKKLRPSIIITFIIVIVLIIISFLTPGGALRKKVLFAGYPIHAIFSSYKKVTKKEMVIDSTWDNLQANQTGYILKSPPVDRDTLIELCNWTVTKHEVSIFWYYTSEYHGYC